MSAAPKAAADLTPTQDEVARSRSVLERVYNEGFFAKLAELGLSPNTEAEARSLLSLHDRTLAAENSPQAKAAAAADRFASINDSVGGVMHQFGIPVPPSRDPALTAQMHKFGMDLLQDPQIRQAIETIKVAEALGVRN
jgi:hypothetical protein